MLGSTTSRLIGLTNKNLSAFAKTTQFVRAVTPERLLSEDPKPRKRTKTVCTIGYTCRLSRPKSESPEMAGKLID